MKKSIIGFSAFFMILIMSMSTSDDRKGLVKIKSYGLPAQVEYSEEMTALKAKYGFYEKYSCIRPIVNFNLNNLISDIRLRLKNGKNWKDKYQAERRLIIN
ncbi:MAG: hypothetical protein MRY83_20215 [Flavobacteriales bacterium]|nr:hypothetical protein [Flavobacteriales bacterium]